MYGLQFEAGPEAMPTVPDVEVMPLAEACFAFSGDLFSVLTREPDGIADRSTGLLLCEAADVIGALVTSTPQIVFVEPERYGRVSDESSSVAAAHAAARRGTRRGRAVCRHPLGDRQLR